MGSKALMSNLAFWEMAPKINADIGVLASRPTDAGKGFRSGLDVGLGCDDELIPRINPGLKA